MIWFGSVAKFIRPLSVRRRVCVCVIAPFPVFRLAAATWRRIRKTSSRTWSWCTRRSWSFQKRIPSFFKEFYASSPVQELHWRKSVLADLLFLTWHQESCLLHARYKLIRDGPVHCEHVVALFLVYFAGWCSRLVPIACAEALAMSKDAAKNSMKLKDVSVDSCNNLYYRVTKRHILRAFYIEFVPWNESKTQILSLIYCAHVPSFASSFRYRKEPNRTAPRLHQDPLLQDGLDTPAGVSHSTSFHPVMYIKLKMVDIFPSLETY